MPIDITMPALSPTMETGTLAKWLVKVGDPVKSGDILCEIETDKATMEVESIDEGTVAELLVADGTEDIKVGAVIARLRGEGEAVGPSDPPRAGEDQPGRLTASPLARRLAAAAKLDLAGVAGSGPRGRIVKADVDAALARPAAAPAGGAGAGPAMATGGAAAAASPSRDGSAAGAGGDAYTRSAAATPRRAHGSRQAVQHAPHHRPPARRVEGDRAALLSD